MISPQCAEIILTRRVQELGTRLAELERERKGDLEENPSDPSDRASEFESEEIRHRLADSTINEIVTLRHALDRIHADRFGVCEHCGQAIAEARLHAIPYATLCGNCAAGEPIA